MNKIFRSVAVGATFAAAAVATGANASTYRNLDTLVASTDGGGEIIIALDFKCSDGGNFVMQTDSRTNEVYRGCALRFSNQILVRWNDGQNVGYPTDRFTRTTTSWMRI